MSAMFEERQQFRFTDDYLDEEQFSEVDYTDESFDTFLTEYEQLHGRIDSRAAGILSADQLRLFRENQENFRRSYIDTRRMEVRALSSE